MILDGSDAARCSPAGAGGTHLIEVQNTNTPKIQKNQLQQNHCVNTNLCHHFWWHHCHHLLHHHCDHLCHLLFHCLIILLDTNFVIIFAIFFCHHLCHYLCNCLCHYLCNIFCHHLCNYLGDHLCRHGYHHLYHHLALHICQNLCLITIVATISVTCSHCDCLRPAGQDYWGFCKLKPLLNTTQWKSNMNNIQSKHHPINNPFQIPSNIIHYSANSSHYPHIVIFVIIMLFVVDGVAPRTCRKWWTAIWSSLSASTWAFQPEHFHFSI